jgi:hypothetical protein
VDGRFSNNRIVLLRKLCSCVEIDLLAVQVSAFLVVYHFRYRSTFLSNFSEERQVSRVPKNRIVLLRKLFSRVEIDLLAAQVSAFLVVSHF